MDSIERIAWAVGEKDANESLERIARSTGRSGNPTDSGDRIAANPGQSGNDLRQTPAPSLLDAASVARQDKVWQHTPPLRAPPTPMSMLGNDSQLSVTQQGSGEQVALRGVCTKELQLCIAPADECFLDAENLERQDKLLRSFEKLNLNLGHGRRSLLRPVELVCVR